MKYARLTKEQFDALHIEFANFLSSQQIDKQEWDKIKTEKPEIAEQELDVFSDLIWEGALNNAKYIEHFSKNHIFLFKFDGIHIETIVIKADNPTVDFMKKEGLQWLSDFVFTEEVDIRTGAKKFSEDRNGELFEIIKQGGILSQGELYEKFKNLLNM